MKKIVFYFAIFVLLNNISFSQEVGFFKSQVVFEPKNSGYFVFIIPYFIINKNNSILAFAEGRKGGGGDWDPSNVVLKTSADGGNTWSDIRVIAEYGKFSCSNIVPIMDYFENKIHLLYVVGYNTVYHTFSTDEGENWEAPINITKNIEDFRSKYNWRVVATGPGHGTQLTNGRLIVPVWFADASILDTISFIIPHYPSITSVLYSDDFGKSWLMGDIVSPNSDTLVFPSEAVCVELQDGRTMFNMRSESINYRRIVSYSYDGVANWQKPYYSDNFFEPICHASMIRYSIQPYQSKNRILFANPDSRMSPWKLGRATTINAGPKRQRVNLTLRISYDEGVTFPIYKILDEGRSGYSDLAVDETGIIHCLYEKGSKNNNHFLPENISMLSFDLNWATNGQDHLSPDDMPLNSNMICAAEKYNNKDQVKKKKFFFKRKAQKSC